jgi:hypothetical protein
VSNFKETFQQLEIDSLNRQVSFIKTHLRNLIVDIEEGMDEEEIVASIKEMIGE